MANRSELEKVFCSFHSDDFNDEMWKLPSQQTRHLVGKDIHFLDVMQRDLPKGTMLTDWQEATSLGEVVVTPAFSGIVIDCLMNADGDFVVSCDGKYCRNPFSLKCPKNETSETWYWPHLTKYIYSAMKQRFLTRAPADKTLAAIVLTGEVVFDHGSHYSFVVHRLSECYTDTFYMLSYFESVYYCTNIMGLDHIQALSFDICQKLDQPFYSSKVKGQRFMIAPKNELFLRDAYFKELTQSAFKKTNETIARISGIAWQNIKDEIVDAIASFMVKCGAPENVDEFTTILSQLVLADVHSSYLNEEDKSFCSDSHAVVEDEMVEIIRCHPSVTRAVDSIFFPNRLGDASCDTDSGFEDGKSETCSGDCRECIRMQEVD